jgi:hypothetical protein
MTIGLAVVVAALTLAAPAAAQGVGVKGYAVFGAMKFAASETFDAVLGVKTGRMIGGGARVELPLGGLFVDIGGWRFKRDGERVYVSGSQVFPLGIPVRVTITPVEITGGWRFAKRTSRVVPYAGMGYSSYDYKETSDFSDTGEDVDERFRGLHLLGGAELRLGRWLGVAGEVGWTRIADALGKGGASAAFDETDLGGTSVRLKIAVGR